MERSDSFSSILVVLFSGFYSFVFILSTVGNIWVLITCYKTLKQRHSPFMWLLANLASADLCFTILTIFNSIAFLWQWVGGNITCKLQGFLIEASYTSTIITLLTISYERLKVTLNPINALVKRWPEKQYFKLIIIWGCSLLICMPLLFIYRVETQQNSVMCLARKRTNFFPQIFYSTYNNFLCSSTGVYDLHTKLHFSNPTSSVHSNHGLHYALKAKAAEDCKDTFRANDGVCNLLVSVYGYSNTYIL